MWQVRTDRPELVAPDGGIADLTKAEWPLLLRLIEARGGVISRSQLMETLYPNGDYPESDRTIDYHVKKIRAKARCLCPDFDMIRTYTGLGYAWRDR